MLKIKTTVDTSGIDKYEKHLLRQFSLFVEKIAYEIKGLAQYYVPVDQGVAKNSIFVSLAREGEASKVSAEGAIEEAKLLGIINPSKYGHQGRKLEFAVDEIEVEPDLRPYLAYISVAVIYGMALEFGTLQNPDPLSVAAENPGAQRPFLSPAVDYYETMFFDGIKAIMSVY